MSPWNWKIGRRKGLWDYGLPVLRYPATLAPWISVLLVLLLIHIIGGRFTAAEGVLFDLPEHSLEEGETTDLVAVVMPMEKRTIVFFDDARYFTDDPASLETFAANLAARVKRTERKTLLVLADKMITGGELMNLAALSKKSGVRRTLFAAKNAVETAE